MSATTPAMPPAPGEKPGKKAVWKRWWFWVVSVLVLAIVAGAAGGGGDTTEAASSPAASATEAAPADDAADEEEPQEEAAAEEPAEEPVAAPAFGDGTWVVGDEMKPGTYRTAESGTFCYWERLKNFTGNFNGIIANGNATGGPIVVTIEKTDVGFSSNGCGEWSTDLSQVTSSKDAFSDGYYVVGLDIAPGTYRVDAKNGCYWERLRNFSGEFDGIIANDNTKGSTIVEIQPSDAGFHSAGCGDWAKV